MKRNKLNNKGFTLIELLAIIVILAIILVITVPQIFDAVDSSKRTALINSSKGLSQWFATTVTSDALYTYDEDKIIKSSSNPTNFNLGESWVCITSETANLAEISVADYNINIKLPDGIGSKSTTEIKADEDLIKKDSCSMIRKNEHFRYEAILVANPDGKLYIGNGQTSWWAASDGIATWTK